MGTLTISITSTPITGTKSYTVSDADVTSLINFMQQQYGTTTPQQALLTWVQNWINTTTSQIQTAGTVLSIPPPVSFA